MKTEYTPTIGLEIHAELKTRTKMFCDSPNNPDEPEPNVNICPVCMAHPGTLPVINKEAVKHMVRIGTAVDGTIADFTEFDRKNYFYPDIPKGYQISQYKYPIVSGGNLAGVELTRIHLEEDTATSTHDKGEYSLVNFNRAGVPLMELVTEPVIHDADTAMRFAKELQLLLRYLGASDANMEKGEMRVEANISLSDISNLKSQNEKLGTKVEVKNLNSFRVVGQAIAYEIKRQTELLENGGEVVQETRGWDENKGETFSQRKKEEADDYRYFPDPDLPKLKLSELSELRDFTLPELPWEKRERYAQYGIGEEATTVFIGDTELSSVFEKAAQELAEINADGADNTQIDADASEERSQSSGSEAEGGLTSNEASGQFIKLASNYLTTDVVGLGQGIGKLTPELFAELITMNAKGDISSRGTKDILKILVEEGGDPQKIAEENGLFQKSDEGELKKVVDEVISENAEVAEEYKNGKEKSLQFLVGQAMKKTQGSANPQMLQELFKESLKEGS